MPVKLYAKESSRNICRGTLGSVTEHGQSERNGTWTLLTGHGHVLVEIARDPGARMRDISARAGITERAVQLIVADLEAAGYLIRHRHGRRNRYVVNPNSAFRHPAQDGHRVGPFLDLLADADESMADADSALAMKRNGRPRLRRDGTRDI